MEKKTVRIELGARSYDIVIGSGLLEQVEVHFPFDVGGKKIFILTDDNVAGIAGKVRDRLRESGAAFCDMHILPHGEGTKSYDFLQKAQGWMLENNIHRNSIVCAVGGGVIGDLAGFAAATVLRGVPYVQIPTTLLSQVDSSVGGKTGINTKQGKNLVGAFYQPEAVIADTATLGTLGRREILAGYAEIVKYGLINDPAFFQWLEKNGPRVCDLEEGAVAFAVETSCKAKAAVVQADEREKGARALLNLGHTFGHALEAAAGYDGTLLHGEAVAIGTVMAFDLSVWTNVCPREDAARVKAHFESVGLPVDTRQIGGGFKTSVEDMICAMKRDKKAMNDKMTFILSRGIGKAFITQDVPEGLVREVLTDILERT